MKMLQVLLAGHWPHALLHHTLIRNFAGGSLLVLASSCLLWAWAGGSVELKRPQRGVCSGRDCSVLLAISGSVWTSGIFLRTPSLWCVCCTWGWGRRQISFSKSNRLRADCLLRQRELTTDNRDHAWPQHGKN